MPTDDFQVYAFAGRSLSCYGMEVVRRTLDRRGARVGAYQPEASCPVLVSLYWPEQIYEFLRWRYQESQRARTIIVGGNYASTSPQILRAHGCEVYLGDGELWDGSLTSPYLASENGPRARAVAPQIMPIQYEDVQDTRRTFAEISRGCKRKCFFCQYGWLKPYREADIVDIREVVRRAKTKAIRVFAADRFGHSQYPAIRAMLATKGKADTGSDITVSEILKDPSRLAYTTKVRVGVEGMSARLRTLCGKPLSDDQLVEFCELVSSHGIKSLDWYMIYGLPTEGPEDIAAYDQLIRRIDAALPPGYALAVHWNAFQPNAQTPFQWAAPCAPHHPDLARLFATKPNQRIKLVNQPTFTGEWTMIRRVLAVRAPASAARLVWNIAHYESKWKRSSSALRSTYREITGTDLMGDYPTDHVFPWDAYCEYPKRKMRSIYESVTRHRVGVSA